MQASGIHLWLILMKAHAALREHAERQVRSLGLCLSDFAILEVLLHKGPSPIHAIGCLVRLTSGSATIAVDRLEEKGLVIRQNDPGDRRARMVHLTETGRALIEAAFQAHEGAMERATSGLTAEERAQTAELLKKLGMEAERLLVTSTQ